MPAAKPTHSKTTDTPAHGKERRGGDSARPNSKKATRAARAAEIRLQFSIRLPANVNAEEFTTKLIALVESVKGTVGGGVIPVRPSVTPS